MKLIACIKKDVLLICGSPVKALLYIVLPVVLLFLLTYFMSGVADSSSSTEAFPIAVIDEDDTFTTRVLITQLRNIPMFSEVRKYDGEDNVTAEELIKNGCAAVITVPTDFFYDLYDMTPTDVKITVNDSMPREASIVKAAVSSIARIIEQNQRVYYAAARIRCGELDDSEMNELYHDYSDASVNAALERLNYFELSKLYSDEEQNRVLFFAAGVCSMLIMFIPLCILRSFYEEKELGMIARLTAAGGSALQELLAKLIAAFAMTAVPVCAVLMLTRVPNVKAIIPGLIIVFLASFAFYLVVGLIFRSGERAQLAGNMIMLLMLILGGALFPYRLLPAALQKLSPVTLPYYVTRIFQAASLGKDAGYCCGLLIPVIAAIPILILAALLLYAEPWNAKGRRRA